MLGVRNQPLSQDELNKTKTIFFFFSYDSFFVSFNFSVPLAEKKSTTPANNKKKN
jgi:hypothetical protein